MAKLKVCATAVFFCLLLSNWQGTADELSSRVQKLDLAWFFGVPRKQLSPDGPSQHIFHFGEHVPRDCSAD